jgi:hypothetical protein
MQRDYSPTYYFRILRAQELLAMYRRDPREFTALAQQFPQRLRRDGHESESCAASPVGVAEAQRHAVPELRADPRGQRQIIGKALNQPEHFGYSQNITPEDPCGPGIVPACPRRRRRNPNLHRL